MPLLKVNNLSLALKKNQELVKIIDNVSFQVQRGETFALLGESGCGKTLTLHAIMQLLPPGAAFIKNSEIFFNEQNLLQLSEASMQDFRGKRIAMIFQEPMTSLNPVRTIGKQIREVIALHLTLSERETEERMVRLLNEVGIPRPKAILDVFPHQLSGGMKQRVMIAMALAADPDLLIADEPTTALDVTIQAQIIQLLKEIQTRTGMAILLVSHDLGVISSIAHHVAVMYAGRIVEQAEAKDFFKNPSHPYSQKLFSAMPDLHKRGEHLAIIPGQVNILNHQIGCRFANRCDYTWDKCIHNEPPLYAIEKNHTARCFLYDNSGETHLANKLQPMAEAFKPMSLEQEVLLKIENLKIYYPIRRGLLKKKIGEVRAVDGMTLELHRGETVAIVGESGCGKTTFAKGIMHLIQVSEGKIIFENQDFSYQNDHELEFYRYAQMVFQDPFSSLDPKMLVMDIVAEGLYSMQQIKNKNQAKQKVQTLLEAVGLPPEAMNRYPHEFSGGQRQRICIARSLALNPRLIICDEPTSALDLSVQAQILNLLRDLQQKFAVSYLFITHNMAVVSYMADKIVVMYLGRMIEWGDCQTILNSPKHPYTQILLACVPSLQKPLLAAETIRGEQPSPAKPPTGCHFHPRCPFAMPICRSEYPVLQEMADGRRVSCHLYDSKRRD